MKNTEVACSGRTHKNRNHRSLIILDLEKLTQHGLAIAKQAGAVLLDFWQGHRPLTIHKKEDNTPATNADLAAHDILFEKLQQLTPQWPVLSEEGDWPGHAERARWDHYWLIDPLDGTRGFIDQLDQFSINIALIAGHQSILGVLYEPVSQIAYYAWQGAGAFKQKADGQPQPIQAAEKTEDQPWRMLTGQYSQAKRLHTLIHQRLPIEQVRINSAIKFGRLAEGKADIYPRLGSISEWDTAAGQCILIEAGGAVVDLQGQTLQYNHRASLLTPEFIAIADPRWIKDWLMILNEEHTHEKNR